MPTAGSDEHTHHVLDSIFVGDRVAAFEHTDITLGIGQEEVDCARLPLTMLLLNQFDAGVQRHVFADNRHRLIRARAGNDDDLIDLHLMQMLVTERRQQIADVLFLVVGRHPDTTMQLLTLRLQTIFPRCSSVISRMFLETLTPPPILL